MMIVPTHTDALPLVSLSNKIPKGLEDFFPPKHSKHPGIPDEDEAAKDTQDSHAETAAKNDDTERLHQQDDTKHKSDRQGRDDRKKSTPPPNSDQANLPGLIGLLILVITARNYLEEQEREMGQEITFLDFQNKLLPYVEKIQVINKQTARVTLNSDQDLPLIDSSSSGTHKSAEIAFHNDGNSNSTSFEGLSSSSSNEAQSASLRRNRNRHKQYFFHIGSVESFEEKLAKAQQHLHPEEWIEVQYVQRTNFVLEGIKFLPFVALVAAVYFGSRGMTGRMPGGNVFNIGKSNAKKITKQDVNVTFADVAGCQQAKQEIVEFVDFLKDASRFTKLGAKIPKGALLCGPPGTGKTLLAKAVAGEAGVPFFSISGSDFIEMFVGVGPSRVRDLFKEAREHAPCIVFIDEIDAVGRQRGRGGFSGGNDERENTLNQLLVEMDGFSPTTGVVVLAGTNRVDILDQALTRPGRFDRQITVDKPDLQGRKEIFQVHLKGIKLQGEIDDYAGRLAGLTPGFAGADIANICNEAAIVAARRKGESVTFDDFEKATDRIIGGLESNKIMSDAEKSIVAHHEAGHAVAGWFLEHADPLLKVTIIPRTSGALGFAQYLPKEVFLRSEDQIMDIVCMALAGRAAEQVFFGNITTGASDDLRRVTQLVYSTIKDFGMNSKLGQLAFPSNDNAGPGEKKYSEATMEAMDDEARRIVDEAYGRTIKLMTERKEEVGKVAKLLLERETITHDDMVDLIGDRPFTGDPAYNEYVSRRKQIHEEVTEKKAEKKELGDDFGGLSPGLA